MILYTDGGCTNNDQKDISKRDMVSVVSNECGDIVAEVNTHGGSNNLAELIAVEYALDYALQSRASSLHIISDSRTAISQFHKDESKRNLKSIRKMNDYEQYIGIKRRIDRMKLYLDVEIEWRPREDNLAGHYIEEKYCL